MNHKNLKSILRSFLEEVWNSGNFSNLENYLASSYEIKDDPGDPWNGKIINEQIFKERVSYSRNAFPDLHFDIQEMIEENDKVAVRWKMSGTHIGDLPQLPATGKTFIISGMTIYYFKDG
ncbi:MAG: hypothetical protein D6814_01020, partial [Calditrichaeota bacterium]